MWNEEWRYTEILHEAKRTGELFDRRRDPLEENDLAAEHPEVVETFRTALDLHFGPERRMIADGEIRDVPLDEETAERLRALGYIE